MLITLRGLGVNYLLNSLVMFLWWYHNFEEDRRSCRLPGQTPVQLMPCSHQFKQSFIKFSFFKHAFKHVWLHVPAVWTGSLIKLVD